MLLKLTYVQKEKQKGHMLIKDFPTRKTQIFVDLLRKEHTIRKHVEGVAGGRNDNVWCTTKNIQIPTS